MDGVLVNFDNETFENTENTKNTKNNKNRKIRKKIIKRGKGKQNELELCIMSTNAARMKGGCVSYRK